jgi:hypothetical protein
MILNSFISKRFYIVIKIKVKNFEGKFFFFLISNQYSTNDILVLFLFELMREKIDFFIYFEDFRFSL